MTVSATPLSAYALWKIEEDERFYSTFPQARYASDQTSSAYAASLHCYMSGNLDNYASNAFASLHVDSPPPTADVPLPISKESLLTSALHYDFLSSTPHQPVVLSPTSPVSHNPTISPHNPFDDISTRSYSPVAAVRPHLVVPSQPTNRSLATRLHKSEPPIMDRLPSPFSTSSESSSYTPLTPRDYLGADAISVKEDCHTPDLWPDHGSRVDRPIVQSQNERVKSKTPITIQKRHGSEHALRQPSHIPRNPYPSPSTLQSLPLSQLPAGSKKSLLRKPPLACHFCRGRKIACGAPDPSNPDRTCNQCERRSLKCEYPLESRRGMRKKKTPTGSNLSAARPKVKVGRRSKTAL